ncbi:MAG: hypothetical protein M1546_16380 [Chloroflexi bacterium]|nr:hypothetical protein [Chloroflexota bacterium]
MHLEGPERDPQVEPHDTSEFVPRGITAFLTLMLVVYALYWAYLWFITTIQRGVGG